MTRVKRGVALALALAVAVGGAIPATAAQQSVIESTAYAARTATAVKTTHNLNLRQRATATSKSLVVVPKGTTLTSLATSGSWHQVKYASKTGWVAGQYLASVAPKASVYRYAQSYQVLRASASAKSKSLGSVARKAKVEYLGKSGSWSKVKVSGKTGFVPTNQLGTKAPAAAYRWLSGKQVGYKSASTSSAKVLTMPAGTKVEWFRTSGSWAQVKSSRGMVWVPASKLRTSAPKPAPVAPKVIGQRWNLDSTAVRKSPSTKAASLGTIAAGQKLDLLATSGSWSQVKSPRGTGWVPSTSLISTSYVPLSAQARWTTTNVNLRAGAGTTHKVLGIVPKAEKVTVLGTSAGWTRVKSSKGTGWLSATYLSTKAPTAPKPAPQTPPQGTEQYRWTTANLNLRSGAGTTFPSKGLVPASEKVRLLKSSAGWSNVTTSKGTGWVSEQYLSATAPATVQPDTLAVMKAVEQRFSSYYTSLGTLRSGSTGHSSGRAVDIMIRNYKTSAGIAAGNKIAQFLLDNRTKLGVEYLIWRDRIWLPHTGWTEYSGSGKYGTQFTGNWNDTTLHNDHIHVETYGNKATGGTLDDRSWK